MTKSTDTGKRRAAIAALDYLTADAVVGIGTGSTVNHLIDLLAAHHTPPRAVVSSSAATTARLKAAQLPVETLAAVGSCDLYVDGADEADAHLQLIKGGGGALTREKIVAAASKVFVCIVDDSKLVKRLGQFPLPIEVIPMARSFVAREIIRLCGGHAQPVWREGVVTDNGNEILDVRNLDIVDASALETALNNIPGVVTNGLFAHRRADVLLVGSETDVRILKPNGKTPA